MPSFFVCYDMFTVVKDTVSRGGARNFGGMPVARPRGDRG